MKLNVSDAVKFPGDAVTQTFGILSVRGAGKTNTAVVMAEEMYAARLPFVVVDPVGVWYGLRSSADGTKPGLEIPVLGGKRGDVPLERGGGELVADLVVDERLSAVLDLSEFDSEASKKSFLLDFARRLYKRNEQPLHLFLEEADDYIPQRPMRDEAQLLRSFENIVRRGRSRGLGITLITQRSASVNKNVLTQVETLIVLRTTSPQDRKAIEEWVKYHDVEDELLESLSGLENGEAWVWSPHWLGELKRVRIRRRTTFDSAATPKERSLRPAARLADVDLGSLQKRMAATIERAKAEDPRELRKKISALERDLRARPKEQIEKTVEKIVEVPVLKDEHLERAEKLAKAMLELADRMTLAGTEMTAEIRKATKRPVAPIPISKRAPAPIAIGRPRKLHRVDADSPADPGVIAPVQQRILNGLAVLEQLGAREPARELVAFLAGYSNLQSKGFVNGIGALRSSGLIDYPASGTVVLTEAGRAAAQYPERPRSAEEVQARVINLLGGASSRILKPLIEAYPEALPREEVAQQAGYGNLQSKGFVNAIGRLRTLGFIDYPDRGTVRAEPVLFLESE